MLTAALRHSELSSGNTRPAGPRMESYEESAVSILFINPVFRERVWGGNRLREWFGDAVPEGTIGEGWVISGLPGESGTIRGTGTTLDEAWRAGEITGEPRSDDLPILVKLLDPADWLSVQVHPDDQQAGELEQQPRGKSECWYVIDSEPWAELILGHTGDPASALSRVNSVPAGELVVRPVRPGTFFMVPAGTVHAVGPGMLLYEVQQSSDTTYRLDDFDRLGLDGKPRELHREKGLAVVGSPFDPAVVDTAEPPVAIPGGSRRSLVERPEFSVTEYRIDGETVIPAAPSYRLGSVVAGEGTLTSGGETHRVTRGDSFIQPVGEPALEVVGDLTLILTEPGEAA